MAYRLQGILLLCFGIFSLLTKAQTDSERGPVREDSVGLFADDPIAAMLDSLLRYKFFEKAFTVPTTSKYNFSPDSVPIYPDSVYKARLKQLQARSPFNLIYNQAVRNYIDLYAIKKRNMTSRMLGLAQLYFPLFEEILDRYNLPLELKYLAIVESAMNPLARSRAGAVGLWQFMYGTGKLQGLKISSYIDERCDPYKSTIAACEYLQFLYDMFGEWEMALAAYNAGPGTVSKAIRRSGGKNTYWEIRPYLPRETQGYVPAFIAVNYVMNYAEEHNLYPTLPKFTFYDVDTVSVRAQLSFEQLAKVLNMPVEEIQFLNPMYRRKIIPAPEEVPYTITLPISQIGIFLSNEQNIYEYIRTDSAMQSLVIKEVKKIHTVRKGETISRIAARYGCTPEDIKAWNHLRSVRLKAGQKIIVFVPEKNISPPGPSVQLSQDRSAHTEAVTVTATSSSQSQEYKIHVVQKGDSLWSIGQQYGVSIDQLRRANNLSGGHKLIPGQKIKIPQG